MPKPIVIPEQKQDNFDVIAPQKQTPVLITTRGEQTESGFGGWTALFLILFLVAVAGAGWFYWQYSKLQGEVKDLEQITLDAAENNNEGVSILDKVNQHILLPHDQQPEILVLDNADALKGQDNFYEYAQNGDVDVKYNSLEILYNPVADVIVNARTRGTVAGAEVRAVQGAITIDIRNGAGVGGLAGKTAQTFSGVKDFIVQNVGNAASSNYSKTILVNLSDKDVTGLEKQFNTQAVKDLPNGEQSSSADVVIILGKS